MKNMKKLLSVGIGCLIIALLTAGCTDLFQNIFKEKPLEDRVKEYMQAQIDGEWDDAYSFLDAASREKTSQESYVQKTRQALCKGYEIEEIAELPSGDQAKVKIRMDISFNGYELKRAPLTQTWAKEKGRWFVSSQPQQEKPNIPQETK